MVLVILRNWYSSTRTSFRFTKSKREPEGGWRLKYQSYVHKVDTGSHKAVAHGYIYQAIFAPFSVMRLQEAPLQCAVTSRSRVARSKPNIVSHDHHPCTTMPIHCRETNHRNGHVSHNCRGLSNHFSSTPDLTDVVSPSSVGHLS